MSLTILLITIGGGSPGNRVPVEDLFTPAIVATTREALGPDTDVRSGSMDAFPSDDEAAELGARFHADAVVEVEWSEPDHLRATIRFERASYGRWYEREIGFQANDDPVERSRTVAFAVASMFPERLAQAARPPERAKPPERGTVGVEDRGSRASEPAVTAWHHSNELSGSAVGAFGVGDYGGSLGGAVDYRHFVSRRLAMRVGMAARVGQDPPAQAVTRFFFGAAGLVWNPFVTANARGVFGFRLDVLAMLADFRRFSTDNATEVDKLKWLPGADLFLEAAYFFTPGAGIFVAAGGEAAFGKTEVIVGNRNTTTLQPVRPVVELGFRAAF